MFTLPIAFGLFAGVAQADDCDEVPDCAAVQVELDQKNGYLEIAEASFGQFKECFDNCSIWPYFVWDRCEITFRTEIKGCDLVYSQAKIVTGGLKIVPIDILEALRVDKVDLGKEIITLKAKIYSFDNIESNKILSIEGQENSTNPLDSATFMDKMIDLLAKMVGLIAFVLLVVGGFRLVAAAGNDNEIQKAKTMIIYSIIGLVVVLLAYIIVATVQGLLYR